MEKYYQMPDGIILTQTARGIYFYSEYDNAWFPAGKRYSILDLDEAFEISEKDFVNYRTKEALVPEKYKDSIYIKRISFRNEVGYGHFPERFIKSFYTNEIPVVHQLMLGSIIEINRPVTFIVGENGTGKSTLLEALAVGFGLNGEGGDSHYFFETKKTYAEIFDLIQIGRAQTPKDGFFLRAESFYNLASAIDDDIVKGNFGRRSLHEQSHGESFMSLIKHRFYGNGLYILDEPEAALSPKRVLELMQEMYRLVNKKSQFIIATHSPILVTYPDAQIYECTNSGIYTRRYQELESFNLYRDFLCNPEYALRSMGL